MSCDIFKQQAVEIIGILWTKTTHWRRARWHSGQAKTCLNDWSNKFPITEKNASPPCGVLWNKHVTMRKVNFRVMWRKIKATFWLVKKRAVIRLPFELVVRVVMTHEQTFYLFRVSFPPGPQQGGWATRQFLPSKPCLAFAQNNK